MNTKITVANNEEISKASFDTSRILEMNIKTIRNTEKKIRVYLVGMLIRFIHGLLIGLFFVFESVTQPFYSFYIL